MSTLKRRMFGDVEVIIKDHLFVAARDFNTGVELTHTQVIQRLGWLMQEVMFGDLVVTLDQAGLICAAYTLPEAIPVPLEVANHLISKQENITEAVEKYRKAHEPKLTTFNELYEVL